MSFIVPITRLKFFKTLRSNVKAENDSFLSNEGLLRKTTNVGKELCPNVIFYRYGKYECFVPEKIWQ